MGICYKCKSKSKTRNEEKEYNYEDKNIKIQKKVAREIDHNGEVISEKIEKNIEVKNDKVNYFGIGYMNYPRIAEEWNDRMKDLIKYFKLTNIIIILYIYIFKLILIF